MPSILKRADFEDYLVRLYFNPGEDLLRACWDRAYRDFCRTLKGIGQLGVDPYGRAKEEISKIKEVADTTQAQFDDWHQSACVELVKTYRERGYRSFYIGHAQEWLNMTFKYVFVLGEKRLPGFGHIYDLCHVPIDNILIDRLRDHSFRAPPGPWSQMDSYPEYLDMQKRVREYFREHFAMVPLDAEFRLWMHQVLPK